ncbi:hypothetical protein V6N11_036620 [Hibiscus sabdariffa]|uniref:Gamma-interferon-inducible lysosomal thiol reductase n=1 Tax=Hibiscus sabdariffa TaxID=183260 RepID=A0ABR2RAY0_9ROSI
MRINSPPIKPKLIRPCRAQNVTLSVYYETLCPYCADFVANHLVKLFEKRFFSIVNLRLVPWGNAVLQTDGIFVSQLENQYAAETARLNPQHKFVPWVLVNDQPLQEDFKNFVTYVCNAYKGKQVPQACHSLPLMNNSSKKATSGYPVCYANSRKN